ncbi:MAG: DUF2318 domain-containing protein [Bacillota bacterium]
MATPTAYLGLQAAPRQIGIHASKTYLATSCRSAAFRPRFRRVLQGSDPTVAALDFFTTCLDAFIISTQVLFIISTTEVRGRKQMYNNGAKKLAFWGVVAISLVVITYYGLKPGGNANPGSVSVSQGNISSESKAGINITKNQVTSAAKFYPYNIDGINMEIIAVKATDGTIRTALNTCQICFDSGRGYYQQEGDFLVCQNCGNRFHIDQVEKIKGGCNPVPVLEGDKQDNGDSIAISAEYLASQKQYFANWKTK